MIDASVPGIVAGCVLAAVVAYALFVYLKPLRGHDSGIGLAFAVLVALWVVKTIALHWLPGYYFDVDSFRTWALRIATLGPAHFYAPGYATDINYPPCDIYPIWPFGAIGRALGLSWENLRIAVETPPLLADLLIGTTMFAYLRRAGYSLRAAWAGMLLVALNPALLFDTVVWGQTDSLVTALMWLATLVALDSEYPVAAAVLAIAVLAKPHALIMIPPLLCWVLHKDGFARLWAPIGAFAATVAVAVIPFTVGRPWDWLPRFYLAGLASYPETSVNAFNLLAIVGGLRRPESAAFLGVSDFAVGLALVLAVLALSCVQAWRNPAPSSLMLAIALALFGEFLFGPRIHERYLYPALVFFAPLALEGVFWLVTFGLLTLNYLFNLAYVLHILRTINWLDTHSAPAMLSAALNLMLFGAILGRLPGRSETGREIAAWPRAVQRWCEWTRTTWQARRPSWLSVSNRINWPSHTMETSPVSLTTSSASEAVAVIQPRAAHYEHPAVFWLIVLLFWRLYETLGCSQPTPYNAHVLLAWSMLHGHFDLINPPGYLELTNLAGRSYVAYGIGPSLLMLPLVALWGPGFNQPSFNAALGGLAVALWWSITGLLGLDYWKRIWLTLLFATGSLFCFVAGQNGNTWSLMHVTTVFGLMLAIYDVLGCRRGWVAGLGFGIAVLSRQPALLALPFFAVMLWSGAAGDRTRIIKRELAFAVALGLLLAFDAYYNYARFGSPFDNGYRRVVEATGGAGPWGLFSIHYLAQNYQIYFLQLPERIPGFPWLNPTMAGFSIFISTPALYLALVGNYRERINQLALAAVVGIQAIYLVYYWTGYAQFGCRYSVDYLPFVMLLAAAGSKYCLNWMVALYAVIGTVIELWGVVWWAQHGW
jgi:Gpi18-like mannosyltransferase